MLGPRHPAKNILWNRELSVSLRTGESPCKADVWMRPALMSGPLKLSQKESCYVTLSKPEDRPRSAKVSKAGSPYSANLDGSDRKTLLFGQGNLTGLAYVELPIGHAEGSELHT
jgi:hypothetical protein